MRCWYRENGWSQTSSKTKYSVDKISSECWHCQDPGILRQDTCISFFDIVFLLLLCHYLMPPHRHSLCCLFHHSSGESPVLDFCLTR